MNRASELQGVEDVETNMRMPFTMFGHLKQDLSIGRGSGKIHVPLRMQRLDRCQAEVYAFQAQEVPLASIR